MLSHPDSRQLFRFREFPLRIRALLFGIATGDAIRIVGIPPFPILRIQTLLFFTPPGSPESGFSYSDFRPFGTFRMTPSIFIDSLLVF